MKLGKKKKNTPGCLSYKAMMYIKSKPAMYGKPMKFKDQKGTGPGITQADVISARTKGYDPKMYGKPKSTETPEQKRDRLKAEYDANIGTKAANKRAYENKKARAKKALGPNPTKAQVEAFKKKFPFMYSKKK